MILPRLKYLWTIRVGISILKKYLYHICVLGRSTLLSYFDSQRMRVVGECLLCSIVC